MDKDVKLILRMPADVHARIKALAEEDRRSLNGEIIHILERYAAQRERAVPETAALLAQFAEQLRDQPGAHYARPPVRAAPTDDESRVPSRDRSPRREGKEESQSVN